MFMGSGQEAAPITDESRYRLLIDAITDYAIYMLDADGRVTSWNLRDHRRTLLPLLFRR